MSEPKKTPDPVDLVLGFAASEDEAPQAEAVELEELLLPLHATREDAPSAGLWDAIEARLDTARDAPGTRTIDPSDGVWEMISPGVERRIVFVDRTADQIGYYLRLEAAAVLPSHAHDHHEHCVVLSGHLQLGSTSFGPGAYHFAERGHDHPAITAKEDAMVFILGGL